jgi:TonB family protein
MIFSSRFCRQLQSGRLATSVVGALLVALLVCAPRRVEAQQNTPAGQVGPAEGPKLTKPPALLKFVEAPYPAVEPRPQGDVAVVMTILIDASGKVSEALVTESAGAVFDEAALAAVRVFEFSPAEIDNKPSPIRIVYRYVFTIREEKVVPTTAVLAGTVRAADTKLPVERVKVELAGGPSTETDAARRAEADAVRGAAQSAADAGDSAGGRGARRHLQGRAQAARGCRTR